MTVQTEAREGDVDHVAVHAQLIEAYQRALAEAGGDRGAVAPQGRAALAALVEDISPLLRRIVYDKVGARFGGRYPEGLLEDAYGEMVAAVLDAAARFDPARCPAFHSWVTGEQGAARAALYACLDAAAGVSGVEKRTRRALSIAAQAETELRARLGRAPRLGELQAAMEDYCYAYQFSRLTPEQQALPPEQWRKLARAKLVNSGMLKAIAEIDRIRQVAARPVSPEELATGWDYVEACQPVTEEAGEALRVAEDHAEMTDLVRLAFAGLSATDRQIVAARLGANDDGADTSLAAVAGHFRVPVAYVKDLVGTATARMQAAHAHFAFLAPGLAAQFEEAPAPAGGSLAGGILSRLQPALG